MEKAMGITHNAMHCFVRAARWQHTFVYKAMGTPQNVMQLQLVTVGNGRTAECSAAAACRCRQ